MLRMYPGWKYVDNRLVQTPQPVHSKHDSESERKLPYITPASANMVNGTRIPSYHVISQPSSSSQAYPMANQSLTSSHPYPIGKQYVPSSHVYTIPNQPLHFPNHPYATINQPIPYSQMPGMSPIPQQNCPQVNSYPISNVVYPPVGPEQPGVPPQFAQVQQEGILH